MLMTPSRRPWSTYTGTQPEEDWWTDAPGRSSPTMRGNDGPVMSRSRSPTRISGLVLRRDRASWTEEDDFPTPPLPDRTMIMFLTEASRRDTGVSSGSDMFRDTSDVSSPDAIFLALWLPSLDVSDSMRDGLWWMQKSRSAIVGGLVEWRFKLYSRYRSEFATQ